MALVGTEVFQVTAVTTRGRPSGATETTTTQQVADLASIQGAIATNPTNVESSIENASALLLPNYRLALTNVRNGTSDARILCIGDSTTAGFGGDGSPYQSTTSYPARLSKLLNSTITPSAVGLGVPPVATTDSRWTLGTNIFNFGAFGSANINSLEIPTTVGTGNLVFTPGVDCDGFYVYYLSTSTTGSINATATGGSSTPLNTQSASNTTVKSVLISAGSASASNTLTLAGPASTNAVFVVAIEPVLSTTKQVLVGNAGVGGSTSGQWSDSASSPPNAQTPLGPTGLISAVAPNLTIISLGINDGSALVPASTLSANLQYLINAVKAASSDVILSTMPPSQSGSAATLEPSYVAVYQTLAQSNNVLIFNEYARLGSAYNTPFMSDSLHPNDLGYWDWSQGLAKLLTSF